MRRKLFLLLTVSVMIFIAFTCQQPAEDRQPAEEVTEVTEVINYQSGLIRMVTVSAITNFDMGYTVIAIPVHTVPSISSFKIGRYEVTYLEWSTVRTWAVSNGYTFGNTGSEGNDGTIGAPPTGSAKNEPVTTINWRDAIVWCNAASEYDGLTPVYYTNSGFTNPLKTSTNNGSINTNAGSEDNPYVNWSANGYRLPTEAEWEAAARYQDGTNWTPGNYASGATADYTDAGATGNVAWYSVNSGSVSHDVGAKNANQLVIYDMSGNVYEWCWDWYAVYTTNSPYTDNNPKGPASGSSRTVRGGSWFSAASFEQVSYRESFIPYGEVVFLGFRVARIN